MEITIPLVPVTKKNSQQIIKAKGRYMIIPSKKYKEYEKACGKFITATETITNQVNVKCLYYMPTKRRVDLVNLEESTLDVLTHYKVIEDDNSNIVVSMDGSRVLYDKENPRTEIVIREVTDERSDNTF